MVEEEREARPQSRGRNQLAPGVEGIVGEGREPGALEVSRCLEER